MPWSAEDENRFDVMFRMCCSPLAKKGLGRISDELTAIHENRKSILDGLGIIIALCESTIDNNNKPFNFEISNKDKLTEAKQIELENIITREKQNVKKIQLIFLDDEKGYMQFYIATITANLIKMVINHRGEQTTRRADLYWT